MVDFTDISKLIWSNIGPSSKSFNIEAGLLNKGLNEFKIIGELITKVIKGLSENKSDNSKIESEVRSEVVKLCSKFPIYSHLFKN